MITSIHMPDRIHANFTCHPHLEQEKSDSLFRSHAYLFRVRVLPLQRIRKYLLVGLVRLVQLRDACVCGRQTLRAREWWQQGDQTYNAKAV